MERGGGERGIGNLSKFGWRGEPRLHRANHSRRMHLRGTKRGREGEGREGQRTASEMRRFSLRDFGRGKGIVCIALIDTGGGSELQDWILRFKFRDGTPCIIARVRKIELKPVYDKYFGARRSEGKKKEKKRKQWSLFTGV